VRVISGDHPTTQKKLAAATAQYNRDQMIPVKLPNAEYSSLITAHGDLGNGQFLCPRSHSTFHYDHLKQTASDVRCLDPNDADGGDTTAEPWRHALEVAITEYTLEHFPSGSVAVYAPAVTNEDRRLVACIVSQFRKHQSTGRWRSEWTIKIPDEPIGGTFSVHGVIKVQTHLYEEGNVQLISSKEVDFSVTAPNAKAFATECVRHIKNAEIAYQLPLGRFVLPPHHPHFRATEGELECIGAPLLLRMLVALSDSGNHEHLTRRGLMAKQKESHVGPSWKANSTDGTQTFCNILHSILSCRIPSTSRFPTLRIGHRNNTLIGMRNT
ncbi:capping protein (actin filament) muscle Z-line alpha, partial [Clonorchis sinensis]